MENQDARPVWNFDNVHAATDDHGLPLIGMRVSRTIDDGLPTFMYLSKARQLRDALDLAIRDAERAAQRKA